MNGFRIPVTVTKDFAADNKVKKIKDSIDNFLELIIVCPNGSFKADYNFGFVFQNYRYVNCDSKEQIDDKRLSGLSVNKNNYAYDLKMTIEEYESRLSKVRVNMGYNPAEKRITIDVAGKYEEDYVEKTYEKNISFLIW